jgi:hypothetical protein
VFSNANYHNRLLLFLIFFPRTPSLPENTSIKQHSYQTAVTVAFICLLHGLAVIFVSFWLILSLPNYLQIWANTLGISSAILAIIQYFPQIWTTYHLRHVGSLSIPMMVIQTPGSFVWAGSLIFRYGTDGWSSWAVFLITGFLQGCLLVMGVYFEILAHKAGIVEDPPVSDVFSLICSILSNSCSSPTFLIKPTNLFNSMVHNWRLMMKDMQLLRMAETRSGHHCLVIQGSLRERSHCVETMKYCTTPMRHARTSRTLLTS